MQDQISPTAGTPTYSEETTLFGRFLQICLDGGDNGKGDEGCACDSLCGGYSSSQVKKDSGRPLSSKAMKESDHVPSKPHGQRKLPGFYFNGPKVHMSEDHYNDKSTTGIMGSECVVSLDRVLSLDQRFAMKQSQQFGVFEDQPDSKPDMVLYDTDPGVLRRRTLHSNFGEKPNKLQLIRDQLLESVNPSLLDVHMIDNVIEVSF